jgi:hypothetical protein
MKDCSQNLNAIEIYGTRTIFGEHVSLSCSWKSESWAMKKKVTSYQRPVFFLTGVVE